MRIDVTDAALVQSLGEGILLGKAFAFIGEGAFKKPALAWVGRILGGVARPRILPLLGVEPLALPGATVSSPAIPALSFASVTSDKALYREGRDEVHLFVLDPASPEAEVVLEVRLDGASFAAHPARLDARGAAAVTLRDLPPGNYGIRLRGAPSDAPSCELAVAAYRLAPLVASLLDRRLEGRRLAVTLRLESFGRPVDGAVQLELTDRGTRLARETAEARGGLVEVSFTLTGAGPHAINAQLVADPSRTATVPIVGSRADERSQTTFSTLGYEVEGSLLPSEGSTPVRGVFLRGGSLRNTPFRLERVDTTRARLVASVDVETARVTILDPSSPKARSSAVDPARAPHPATNDERYRRGEALFQEGRFAASREAFEGALAVLEEPHPNYAYYVACCFAREGDRRRAVAALRRALRDGWRDFELLERDDDLAALRGYEPYEALKLRGVREVELTSLAAGESVELDVPEPMSILAVGAYVRGEPWEGWAATIAPAEMAPVLTVPERAAPGDDVRVEVDTGRRGDDVSVYLVVKDARLLAPDTPLSRLAGALKAVASRASAELAVGKPALTLAQAVPPPPPLAPICFSPPPMGAPAPPPMARAMLGAVAGPAVMLSPPPPLRRPAMPAPAAPGFAAPAAPAAAPASPYREAPELPPPATLEEPEVLFAGLVDTRAGRASLSLRLGPDFAEYVVEAFAVAGLDWAPVEARFRAEKQVFASLDLPAFVHPDDAATARLQVGSAAGARVRVTRDGAEVPLLLDGRALEPGERVVAGRAELTFLAGPGLYEATLEDGSGAAERVAKDVAVPGKLRRFARTLRLLEPGQRLSRDDEPGIVGLRVLRGMDQPFTALVDATSDYGHACCEQTAAKMLAACAMFALAGDDRGRRSRAESIILAGVRREQSMWLRGRGFKMYPESAPEPNAYWGSKASRHLWNLAMVRDLEPSRALAGALAEGLAMAEDTTRAYRLEWPPRALSSCEDAYAAVRFGKANGAAVSTVRRLVERGPFSGGAVAVRSETAYGAAALLRAGGASERQRALSLTNAVVRDIGPLGRLYSTVDSAAAIALMSELLAAKVVGGSGSVEVDGVRLSTEQAAERSDVCAVRALDAVTAVEVSRVVEEDWSTFGAGLPLAVRLLKDETPTRRLSALDPVELEVTIEGGYKAGDLLWVCLPDALSRVVGGGQVKQFAVDFEGKSTVRVSLAATGVTVGKRGEAAPSRFAVCVRNMFEEERGGSPGYIEVSVAPPAGGGALGKVVAGLKGLFGG